MGGNHKGDMNSEWKNVDLLAAALKKKMGRSPEIAAVLGSGLGSVAQSLENPISIPMSSLLGWPCPSVEGHAGMLHKAKLGGAEILLLQGRVHLYEGYKAAEVVRPVRAAIAWGVKTVILTNAAGGVNPALEPGSLMIIEDHVNLTGHNPLVGQNDDRRGQRFPEMSEVYASDLCEIFRACAADLDMEVAAGVYAGLIGPSFETPAEVRMLRSMSIDAVGMSTVLEAIAARHMGAKVAGISIVANRAAGLDGVQPSHEEVSLVAKKASSDLAVLLTAAVGRIGKKR